MSRELSLVIHHQFSTVGDQVYRAGAEKTVGAIAHETEAFVQAVNGLSWAEVGGVDAEAVADTQTYAALESAGVDVLPDGEFEPGEIGGDAVSITVNIPLSVTVTGDVDNAQATKELEALVPEINVTVA